MPRIFKKIAIGLGVILLGAILWQPFMTYAAPFLVAVGGTGTTTPSGILYGDNGSTNHLKTVTIGSNITFSGGTLSASGGGSYPFQLTGNATSTLTQFNGGLTAFGTSTVGDSTQTGGLTISGGATTTGSLFVGSPFTSSGAVGVGVINASGSVFSNSGFDIPGITILSSHQLYNSATMTFAQNTTQLGNVQYNTMTLFNNGSLGIGTSTPTGTLSVTTGGALGYTALAPSTSFIISSSTQGIATTTLFSVNSAGITQIGKLATPAGTFLAADPNGNIIATTTPTGGSGAAYPFNVAVNSTSTLTGFNGGLTSYASTTIGNGVSGGENGLTVSGDSTTTGNLFVTQRADIGVSDGGSNGDLRANRIVADTIISRTAGTVTFSQPIDVHGSAGTNAGTFDTSSNSAGALTGIDFHYNNNGANSEIAQIQGLVESGGGGDLLFNTAASGVGPYVTQAELTRAGNFGIGTTSPWGNFSVNNSTNSTAGEPLFVVASSTAAATTTAFEVDNQGDVGIGQLAVAGQGLGLTWSGNVTNPTFTATSNYSTLTLVGNTTNLKLLGGGSGDNFDYMEAGAGNLKLTGANAAQGTALNEAFNTISLGNQYTTTAVGIASSTPFGAFTIQLAAGHVPAGNNAFLISSSTTAGATTTLLSVSATGAVDIPSLSAGTVNVAPTTGALYNTATTSLSANNGITLTGTAGALIGGTNVTAGLSTISQGVLSNNGSASAVPTSNATSTLFTGSTGQIPYFSSSGALVGTSSLTMDTGGDPSIPANHFLNLGSASMYYNSTFNNVAFLNSVAGGGLQFQAASFIQFQRTSDFASMLSIYPANRIAFFDGLGNETNGIIQIYGTTTNAGALRYTQIQQLPSGYLNFTGQDSNIKGITVNSGAVGIGTTTPTGLLAVYDTPTNGTSTAFVVGSSTASNVPSTLFSVSNIGSTTIGNFGTCSGTSALTTTSSGTIVCGTLTAGTPAPNNTDVQYNNSGAFGASDNFQYSSNTEFLNSAATSQVLLNARFSGTSVAVVGYDSSKNGQLLLFDNGSSQNITLNSSTGSSFSVTSGASNVLTATANSSGLPIAIAAQDGGFANTSPIASLSQVNGTDSGPVLKLSNAGTGNFETDVAGGVNKFIVTSAGVASTTNLNISALGNAAGSFLATNAAGTVIATTSPQVALTLTTTGSSGAATLSPTGALNIPNYIAASSGQSPYSWTVAATGATYTTIQAAMTQCGAVGGGNIILTDPLYTQGTTGLTWRGSNCAIWGRNAGTTTISFTGATTGFKTNTPSGDYTHDELHNVLISGDSNASGVAIDWSDMTHGIVDGVQITAFARSLRFNDTQNITFYNSFTNIDINNGGVIGIDASSTNPVNGNYFNNIFIGSTVANFVAFQMNNGNGNTFSHIYAEPGSITGTVGLKLFDNKLATNNGVFNNEFDSWYIEANATGVLVPLTVNPAAGGIQRNTFNNMTVESNTLDWNVVPGAQQLNTFTNDYDSNFGVSLNSFGGPLGIGTSTEMSTIGNLPSAQLAVNASTTQSNNAVLVGLATTNATFFRISNTGTVFAPATASSGAAQTGYWCYDANGQLIRDTALCLTSAARFKDDISNISASTALDEALQLQPVSYYYKSDFNGSFQSDPNYNGEQVGFVADQVQQVDPRLVDVETATTTFEGVTYAPGTVQTFRPDAITAVLDGAIKAQQTEIDALKSAGRSAEENWQWGLIALLVGYAAYNEWDKRRRK